MRNKKALVKYAVPKLLELARGNSRGGFACGSGNIADEDCTNVGGSAQQNCNSGTSPVLSCSGGTGD
ncbi:MAG: hypothetical protein HQ596_02145 [Candidatus Saganbacteria bacterium]|nr:hypothetical protein [Candidatus Saganbacteria bacterium]